MNYFKSKLLLMTTVIMFLCSRAFAQDKINFGQDQCSFCKMTIKDKLHAAIALDNEGRTYKFDAIEGLINFLKENDDNAFEKLLVADYSAKGELVDAKSATYLKSEAIPSPMGAFLSGFDNRDAAEKVQKKKGGELFTWNQIRIKFKDSRFGVLDAGHDHHDHSRPDLYAPIGIMGDHLHERGDFMISLRYMNMSMDGNQSGGNSIGTTEIHSQYMVAPQNMSMEMYMLGIMYSPSSKLTVMLMQNVVKNEMELSTRMGMDFSTKSDGLGDMKISALYHLKQLKNSSIHFNSSINVPIGGIQNVADTPMAEGMRLPYPMQLGSGTYDLTFGVTYRGSNDVFSWGVQQLNTIRPGHNSQKYNIGDAFVMNSWFAYRAFEQISFSMRVQGMIQNEIDGMDEKLNPMMVTTADTNNSGFQKLKSYIGMNVSFAQSSSLHGLSIGLEGGIPIYQYVEGIQMTEKSTWNLGVRYSI